MSGAAFCIRCGRQAAGLRRPELAVAWLHRHDQICPDRDGPRRYEWRDGACRKV